MLGPPGRRLHGEAGMVEQRPEFRRKLIRTIVGCVSAGMLFGMRPAQASDKMTRQQAQYQDTPNGIYSCGMCTLFEAPNACKVVEGEVSKDGWCKAFAPVD
jgi:hypothetical protein